MNSAYWLLLILIHAAQIVGAVGLVWLIARVFRKRSRVVWCLWFVVLIKCVTPPVVGSSWSLFSIIRGPWMSRTVELEPAMGLEEVDPAALGQAISDILNGVESRVTEEQLGAAFEELGAKMEAKQAAAQAEAEAAAKARAQEGLDFLAKNKSAEGVTTTESGLQYKIEVAGEGDSPTAADTVSVHYEGRLLNGKVFDSSYDRGAPASFGVSQVIPGWTEALQLMKPGAKWEVWIPSEIAYGARGAGADIGPNEVLNFTIELLEVSEK